MLKWLKLFSKLYVKKFIQSSSNKVLPNQFKIYEHHNIQIREGRDIPRQLLIHQLADDQTYNQIWHIESYSLRNVRKTCSMFESNDLFLLGFCFEFPLSLVYLISYVVFGIYQPIGVV